MFKGLLHSYTSFLISFLIFCLSWHVNWWCLSNELVATELQWLWVNVGKRDTAIYWAVFKTKIIHTSHAYCHRHWPHSNRKFFCNVIGSFLLTVSCFRVSKSFRQPESDVTPEFTSFPTYTEDQLVIHWQDKITFQI